METSIECPVCGKTMAADEERCSECGFSPAEQTEAFDPLELSGGDAALAAASIASKGTPQLVLTKGPSKGGVFYLESFPISIGRDTGCDIFLNNRTVSRKHAMLDISGNAVIVRDNKSLNGTWVDGKVVEEAVLTDGCLLQIGTFSMRFSC
jgi:hypothetical protein